MIGYLEGKILLKDEERILLLVSHVGYEVLVPAFVLDTIKDKNAGDPLSLYIYYQQTERQPKPVLIGFNSENEKEFFQHFISVEAIGPLKAVKALSMPVGEIASAIEAKDVNTLKNLKGIGARTAQKIIATLAGKMEKFVLVQDKKRKAPLVANRVTEKVLEVLTEQLGHKIPEAREMIAEALERNSSIASPEELFDEIYRGSSMKP
ncbi:MAG: Holliday junction branch migration protein RuvA [Desulfococcaceae bacterium]